VISSTPEQLVLRHFSCRSFGMVAGLTFCALTFALMDAAHPRAQMYCVRHQTDPEDHPNATRRTGVPDVFKVEDVDCILRRGNSLQERVTFELSDVTLRAKAALLDADHEKVSLAASLDKAGGGKSGGGAGARGARQQLYEVLLHRRYPAARFVLYRFASKVHAAGGAGGDAGGAGGAGVAAVYVVVVMLVLLLPLLTALPLHISKGEGRGVRGQAQCVHRRCEGTVHNIRIPPCVWIP